MLFFIYIYVCLFPLLCESKRFVTTFYLDPTCSGEPQFREYDAAFDDFCTPSPCQASTIHSFLYRKRECPETYVSLGLDQRSCSSGATNIWRSYDAALVLLCGLTSLRVSRASLCVKKRMPPQIVKKAWS